MKEALIAQRKAYLEIMAIHKWWNVDRFIENDVAYSFENELKQSDKENEMIARLIAVRKCMWT